MESVEGNQFTLKESKPELRFEHYSLNNLITLSMTTSNKDIFERLKNGVAAYLLFEETQLCSSRAEARRLIQDGGAYINGRRVQNFDETVREADLKNGLLVLRAGKKRYHRIIVN